MEAKFVWCNDRPAGKGAAEDDQHGPHHTPHNRGRLDEERRGLSRGNGSIYRGRGIRTEIDDGGMQRTRKRGRRGEVRRSEGERKARHRPKGKKGG